MEKDIFPGLEQRMDKAIVTFREELSRLRTGRASVSLLDTIRVDYYGTPSPLTHVSNLAVPENRLITIQPWEPKMLPEIERAIIKADLGLNPQSDGKILRIPIPPLNEERRKELVKVVKKMAEDHRVAIRNIRREGNDKLQKLEKDKAITEDEKRRMQKKLQDVTDGFIKKVDEVLAGKEKEIMEV